MAKTNADPYKVYLYPNGAVSCRDIHGNVIPDFNHSWVTLYLEFLESKGIDPMSIKIFETMIEGKCKYVRPVKIKGEWTWTISDTYK